MKIDAISTDQLNQIAPQPQNNIVEEPNVAIAEEPGNSGAAKNKEKNHLRGENGVLRLLQEGHFKPNAEMVLRQVFHTELAILAGQNKESEEQEETEVTNTE
ncbi:hypothetical protein CEE37_13565 [candidate division LCP-89 bacterium B3_LCP]|uniref:Uncharacterized protein n=1 Tax=candidate division LCP-89 bacterium B3_LCP TaxID=2012998 RepID=A0A532USR8_UNCL8|nr:MAG: hypothetical protein CEE37_13565 [candidate division LCP-89 bacterium B3_LCP]